MGETFDVAAVTGDHDQVVFPRCVALSAYVNDWPSGLMHTTVTLYLTRRSVSPSYLPARFWGTLISTSTKSSSSAKYSMSAPVTSRATRLPISASGNTT